MAQATTVPNTVAMAAPAMPRAGKPEVPFDEQVVAADVQNAGGHIGGHGDRVLPLPRRAALMTRETTLKSRPPMMMRK